MAHNGPRFAQVLLRPRQFSRLLVQNRFLDIGNKKKIGSEQDEDIAGERSAELPAQAEQRSVRARIAWDDLEQQSPAPSAPGSRLHTKRPWRFAWWYFRRSLRRAENWSTAMSPLGARTGSPEGNYNPPERVFTRSREH